MPTLIDLEDDSFSLSSDPIQDLFRNPCTGPVVRTREKLEAQFPRQARDLVCPDCGGKLVLKDGKYGIFYGCVNWDTTQCKGAHNCNKGTGEPLGIPGDAETRALRKQVHTALSEAIQKYDSEVRGDPKLRQDHSLTGVMDRWKREFKNPHMKISILTKDQCLILLKSIKRAMGGLTRFERLILQEDSVE